MKKLISGALILAACTFHANADDYNRLNLTYSNTHFGYNKYFTAGSDNNFSTNGAGIGYSHGFSLIHSCPIFLETGLNVNFNFGSLTINGQRFEEQGYWARANATQKIQFIDIQVPLNFVYQYHATSDFSIAPYAGLNLKVNLMGRYRTDYRIDTNIPMEILNELGYYASDLSHEGDWINVFSRTDMGSNAYTWNRVQVGWQVGVGFGYKHAILSVQYGTDFIPAYKYEEARVSTGTFRLTLGYNF